MHEKILFEVDTQALDVEVLVNPAAEVMQQSTIAPGMGILYRYHPDANQRLADGFPRFIQDGQGRLAIARVGKDIIGYVVIVKPDLQERWGDPNAPALWELGFIEVARGWRGRGIGRKLLRACFADGSLDDQIVLATAYSWHWDLDGTGLSKNAYRKVLDRFFGFEGFQPLDTDEPNIMEDPANRLLVRIGPRVRPDVCAQFLALAHADQGRIAAHPTTIIHPGRGVADLLAHSYRLWSPSRWLAPWAAMWFAASCQMSKAAAAWWLGQIPYSATAVSKSL